MPKTLNSIQLLNNGNVIFLFLSHKFEVRYIFSGSLWKEVVIAVINTSSFRLYRSLTPQKPTKATDKIDDSYYTYT